MTKYAEMQNEIAAAENRLQTIDIDLRELLRRRKGLEADRGRALVHGDVTPDALKAELADVDAQVEEAEATTAALRSHIERQRAYLSEQAVVERKKSALQAIERVDARADELLSWVAEFDAWSATGEALFKKLDEFAQANRNDLHHAARTAHENDLVSDAEQRALSPFGSAIDLRIDSVLAWWLLRMKIEQRVQGAEIPRPIGAEIPLASLVELHCDRLAELVRRLQQKIEQSEEETE